MRHHLFVGAAAALFAAGPAIAEDRPAGPEKAAQKSIQRFDKDKDGALTRSELPADLRAGFQNLDKSGDGKLDAGELKANAARMQACVQPVEVVTIWTIEAVDPVTRQELQTAYDRLRQLDKNSDGQIAQDEVAAAREQAIVRRADAVFQRLDANDDGKVSMEEAPGQGGFPTADTNNDGSLTRDELKAAIMSDANSARQAKPGQEK